MKTASRRARRSVLPASCGVDIDQLERRETDKGAWLYTAPDPARTELRNCCRGLASALAALPIPRRMRWGDRSDEFVRPVKWLVMMIDDDVVDAEAFGLRSGT